MKSFKQFLEAKKPAAASFSWTQLGHAGLFSGDQIWGWINGKLKTLPGGTLLKMLDHGDLFAGQHENFWAGRFDKEHNIVTIRPDNWVSDNGPKTRVPYRLIKALRTEYPDAFLELRGHIRL